METGKKKAFKCVNFCRTHEDFEKKQSNNHKVCQTELKNTCDIQRSVIVRDYVNTERPAKTGGCKTSSASNKKYMCLDFLRAPLKDHLQLK